MPAETETIRTLEIHYLVTVQAPLDREDDREWIQNTVQNFLASLLKDRVTMPVEVALQHSRVIEA